MKQRIIEVSSDGRYLHADRGFLVIKHGTDEVGRVPIDDVGAVIGSGHGLVFSGELLVRLADRGSPLVICDAPPVATPNSPICGRVKIPQLSARDGWMVTRSPDGSQREPQLL